MQKPSEVESKLSKLVGCVKEEIERCRRRANENIARSLGSVLEADRQWFAAKADTYAAMRVKLTQFSGRPGTSR